ncbi:hypothetical protein QAD02_006625 [Eretmocerus hayati]|uniref:Uncharacterized protein n=1 Tax=Eretmocerus hayati TaxID=131215 RepID=A0ACC2N1U6_9HYME|nr:hypothetical protein QAD02_006625 [Eretmocerus hayati]
MIPVALGQNQQARVSDTLRKLRLMHKARILATTSVPAALGPNQQARVFTPRKLRFSTGPGSVTSTSIPEALGQNQQARVTDTLRKLRFSAGPGIVSRANENGTVTREQNGNIDFRTRIKNGEEVRSIKDYPFMVGILDKGRYRCCGTIISRSAILTAAHCTDNVQPTDLTVRVGSVTRDYGGKLYSVDRFVRPPNYSRNMYVAEYDIAILKLKTALPTGGIVKPVNLIQSNERIPERSMGTAIGWGRTWNKEYDQKGWLRYVDFPLLPKGICSFDEPNAPQNLTGQICAGDVGEFACAGDSGGPLMVENRQVGIAIRSECYSNAQPTRYVDVSYVHDWIDSNLWNLARETIGEWDVKSGIYFPK